MLHVHVIHGHAYHLVHLRQNLNGIGIVRITPGDIVQKADVARPVPNDPTIDLADTRLPPSGSSLYSCAITSAISWCIFTPFANITSYSEMAAAAHNT
jgi:hypothetical protein